MAAFLAPFLGTAAASLAPAVIDALLSKGAPQEFVGGKELPAIRPEEIQKQYGRYKKRKLTDKEIGRRMANRYGGRPAVRAMKGPGIGTKALHLSGMAMTPLFLLQMLKPDLFMPNMEEMAGAAGGGQEDVLSMLAQLQGMTEDSGDLRGEEAFARGAASAADRRQIMSTPISGLGYAGGLEELIRGHEEELGRIAHNEPMTLAQAYAMQGLYQPQEQTRFDFRGLM